MPEYSNTIRELLESGVHFGHQTNKWNPKMGKFIFGEKSGIYIIDLKKTEEALNKAIEFLYRITSSGKTVLFVGTKKQAKQIIRDEAQRCEMFFVDERWLGGCLTNFATIRKSVDKLNKLQEMKGGEIYTTLSKKEKANLDRDERKLLNNLGGIRTMERVPDCLVVVDAEAEEIAIKEARKIGMPVIALLDTNCDPNMVDYPIPGNDDAIRSIQYIISRLADSAEKGYREFMGKSATVREEKTVPVTETKQAKNPDAAVLEKEETKAAEPAATEEKNDIGENDIASSTTVDGDIKLDATEE